VDRLSWKKEWKKVRPAILLYGRYALWWKTDKKNHGSSDNCDDLTIGWIIGKEDSEAEIKRLKEFGEKVIMMAKKEGFVIEQQ
jgi:hypothetical protein